jgi:hypothetical protein
MDISLHRLLEYFQEKRVNPIVLKFYLHYLVSRFYEPGEHDMPMEFLQYFETVLSQTMDSSDETKILGYLDELNGEIYKAIEEERDAAYGGKLSEMLNRVRQNLYKVKD